MISDLVCALFLASLFIPASFVFLCFTWSSFVLGIRLILSRCSVVALFLFYFGDCSSLYPVSNFLPGNYDSLLLLRSHLLPFPSSSCVSLYPLIFCCVLHHECGLFHNVFLKYLTHTNTRSPSCFHVTAFLFK